MLFGAESTTEDVISGVLDVVQPVLEYLGTIAFAITGALVAGRKRMDLGGVVVLGVIVAVGGGTLRDVVLARQVFWVDDPAFLAVGAATALVAVPVFRVGAAHIRRGFWLVQTFDSVGMALFVVTGTNIALDAGANDIAAAAIGVASGVTGGILRDLLASEIPEVLVDGRLYLTAALVGAATYIVLLRFDIAAVAALWIPIALILALRFATLRLGIGVPTVDMTADDRPGR